VLFSFLSSHTRLRAHQAPGIPCALLGADDFLQQLGRDALRERGGVFATNAGVIASVAKQSIVQRVEKWIASSLRSSQ
jgi:hypothetical protein